MKNGAIAALVLVTLVIGSGIGFLASSITSVTTTTTQTTVQACTESLYYPEYNQTTLSNGTQVSVSFFPVLLANPGSSMVLCVNFETIQGNNQTYSGKLNAAAYAWNGNRSVVHMSDITVTPIPGNVMIGPGQIADVQYLVEISRNSTGRYGLNILGCMLFPLAIGNESSQFKLSDFPEFPSHGCRPSQPLQGMVVGYSGAKVGFIRTERRYTPSIMVSQVTVHAFPNAQGIENVTVRTHIRSFAQPFTIGLSLDASYTHEFRGNPELTNAFTNDLCNWSIRNESADFALVNWPFQEGLSGFMKADAPELTISAYSNATYSFSILMNSSSILMNGRIANYTAIDLALYAKVPGSVLYVARWVTIVSYFPVNISGYLQSISGSCSSTYGE